MKNFLIFILGAILIVGGFLYLRAPTSPLQKATPQQDVYYCPMHPQIKRDKPGACPICYMKLIKKEEDDVHAEYGHTTEHQNDPALAGHAPVKLTAGKQQMIGVKTAPVVRKELTKTIRAYGYVAHDLELYNAQLEYIEAWREYYAFAVRRSTKENFRVDWRDYYVTSASEGRRRNQDEIKAQQRLIKVEYELRHMGLSENELAQLREIKYGQPWVQPDLLFFEEGHPTWVYAQVFEADLGFIAVGQKAKVIIPAYGEVTEGIIRNVAQMIEPNTRTARVRIQLPSYRGELSVNMYVSVEILSELNTSLVISREAIMDTGLNKIVFVQKDDGVFEPRRIETGFEGNGMMAVTSGLEEGETIVVSGNFLLDSESRLKAVIQDTDDTASVDNAHTGH